MTMPGAQIRLRCRPTCHGFSPCHMIEKCCGLPLRIVAHLSTRKHQHMSMHLLQNMASIRSLHQISQRPAMFLFCTRKRKVEKT